MHNIFVVLLVSPLVWSYSIKVNGKINVGDQLGDLFKELKERVLEHVAGDGQSLDSFLTKAESLVYNYGSGQYNKNKKKSHVKKDDSSEEKKNDEAIEKKKSHSYGRHKGQNKSHNKKTLTEEKKDHLTRHHKEKKKSHKIKQQVENIENNDDDDEYKNVRNKRNKSHKEKPLLDDVIENKKKVHVYGRHRNEKKLYKPLNNIKA